MSAASLPMIAAKQLNLPRWYVGRLKPSIGFYRSVNAKLRSSFRTRDRDDVDADHFADAQNDVGR